MDERMRARRRSVAREAARRRRRWVYSVAGLVVLAVALVAIARSPLFAITDVRVTGVGDEQLDAVLTAAGIQRGANLVSVDLAGAAARVEALPWVRSAELRRDLPSAVEIDVSRRQPVAVVLVAGGAWLVDAEAVVVSGGAEEGLVVIDAVNSVLPGSGVEISDAAVRNALEVHAGLPDSLRQRITRYEAPSERGLRLLVDGVWVRFGAAERLGDKAAVIETLLDQARAQARRQGDGQEAEDLSGVAELDVRAPDNPVLVPAAGEP